MKALPVALIAVAVLGMLAAERVCHLDQHGDPLIAALLIAYTCVVVGYEVFAKRSRS